MGGNLISGRIVSVGQHIEKSINIPRFIIKRQARESKNFQPKILFDPVGNHIHARHCSTPSPDIAINDPLLLLCPLDIRVLLLQPIVLDVIDRSPLAIQNAGGCDNPSTSAGREQQLSSGDMAANKALQFRSKIAVRRTIPADDENIQFRDVIRSDRRHDCHRACKQVHRLQGLCDMVEDEFGCLCYKVRIDGVEETDSLEERLTRGIEYIEWSDNVDRLVIEEQSADVDGSHFGRFIKDKCQKKLICLLICLLIVNKLCWLSLLLKYFRAAIFWDTIIAERDCSKAPPSVVDGLGTDNEVNSWTVSVICGFEIYIGRF